MSEDLIDNSQQNNMNTGMQKVLPNSTATLVLGIISIVGCFLYAIPGIVCGIIAIFLHKKDKLIYESNPALYENSFKSSKAGQICGIVGLSLSVLFIVFLIIYFIFMFSMISAAASGGFR